MQDQNPESSPATIVPKSPKEALFLQFAQAYYQEMQSVGKNAPFGQVFNQVDAFAFENPRGQTIPMDPHRNATQTIKAIPSRIH